MKPSLKKKIQRGKKKKNHIKKFDLVLKRQLHKKKYTYQTRSLPVNWWWLRKGSSGSLEQDSAQMISAFDNTSAHQGQWNEFGQQSGKDVCEEIPRHPRAIYNTDILTLEETGTFLTQKKLSASRECLQLKWLLKLI